MFLLRSNLKQEKWEWKKILKQKQNLQDKDTSGLGMGWMSKLNQWVLATGFLHCQSRLLSKKEDYSSWARQPPQFLYIMQLQEVYQHPKGSPYAFMGQSRQGALIEATH